MKNKPKYWYKQSAVIPYKKNGNKIEVLLVTTRKKKKWIIPKGIIEENLTARESAIKEAYEEAGIKGNLLPHKLGKYSYRKWGGKCKVKVYGMEVTSLSEFWEENFRERKWVSFSNIQNYIKNEKIIAITTTLKEILNNKT